MPDDFDSQRIDPEQRFGMGGELRYFERVGVKLLDLLPGAEVERTRDCVQITEHDEKGIVLLITPEAIEIRLPTVEWPHPHIPAGSSKLDRRILLDEFDLESLQREIESARTKRRNQFRECEYCRRPTPPEHAHTIDGKYACHGCSENELGIVH